MPERSRLGTLALNSFLPDPTSPEWNSCAQATGAALLEPFALGPFAMQPRPPRARAISALMHSHPPDAPLGLGTTAFGLARLLSDHGFQARVVHGSWFGWRRERTLAQVAAYAAAGWPVPVCLDDGLLGGRAFEAHWALVHAVHPDHLELSLAGSRQLPMERFLEAWACRHLPYTHNHAAVLADR